MVEIPEDLGEGVKVKAFVERDILEAKAARSRMDVLFPCDEEAHQNAFIDGFSDGIIEAYTQMPYVHEVPKLTTTELKDKARAFRLSGGIIFSLITLTGLGVVSLDEILFIPVMVLCFLGMHIYGDYIRLKTQDKYSRYNEEVDVSK